MNGALSIDLAGIRMKTPLMAASGTFGFGEDFADFIDLKQAGAVVVKGLTLEARRGNAGRRIAETPDGMLNCIGLQNPGVENFLQEILPRIKKYEMPIIVNINGNVVEDYAGLAEALDKSGVAGIEVNISCPNTKHGCMAFGVVPETAAAVTEAVRAKTSLPVIVKLSPNVTDITVIAKAVEAAGADAVSLINTIVGMSIDTKTWRPVLGNVVGGLSGPAVKPIALRMVWQTAQAVKIPVIGMGGISNALDAVEFFLAGARAVAIGTANFVNPCAMQDIAKDLTAYLDSRGLSHISQIIGQIRKEG